MKKLILLIATLTLCGCSAYKAWFGNDLPLMTSISLTAKINKDGEVVAFKNKSLSELEDDEVHLGAIISWSPRYNAAYIGNSGEGCVQPAAYARTQSGDAAVPVEVFSMLLNKEGGNGNATVNVSEALDKLVTVTDQSTFFSIGVFGLCQLHANGALSEGELASLMSELIVKVATLNGSSPSPPSEDEDSKK